MKFLPCIIGLLLAPLFAYSQNFVGVWRAEQALKNGIAKIELRIAKPSNEVLYPAHIYIEYQRFKGLYEVLLAQKDLNTLAIGRDKYPIKESPYNLGSMLLGLNGYLNLQGAILKLKPIPFKANNYNFGTEFSMNPLKVALKSFLYQNALEFKKISADEPANIAKQKITNPSSSDLYFGIYQTKEMTNGMVTTKIYTQKNNFKDSVSLSLNGQLLHSKIGLKNGILSEQIDLKKGINTFILFADNFGSMSSNSGILRINTVKKAFEYQLGNAQNQFGTFIVAQLDLNTDATVMPFATEQDAFSQEASRRVQQLIGKIHVKNPEVKLEVWDAQQEDGDLISIGLNNQWLSNSLEVKNKAKVIPIKLKAGKNTLLFMAENLGSIPPNTAYIKIKFDHQEKILEVNTNLSKNNILELYVN